MKAFVTLALVVSASFCQAAGLPRSAPEEQGVSSADLQTFVEKADKSIEGMHSVMVVRHGHVIAEGWWTPYRAEARHEMYSLSKSFTSTAVGLAIAEGKMSLDDEVIKFFPDDVPENPSQNLKSMRVRDLLRMSTGHVDEPPRPPDAVWTKAFLAQEVPFKPGTHFLYNTSATYMLSAMVQKATGETVLDYLKPRLFDPLGIENPTWGTSPQGISLGGYGLNIRTEDIAKFGQLYLQKGKWEGKQIVPERWVAEATTLQTSNGSNPNSDWDQGYCYQFWRARHNAYRGDGAFGQYCIVMPDQDTVVAITSGVKDMQAVLNVVWDSLLPALKDEALSPDNDARQALESTLTDLTMPPQDGSVQPKDSIVRKVYTFEPGEDRIESLSLETGDDATSLIARINGADRRITCGKGTWTDGRFAYSQFPEQPVAASGGWTNDDTFTAKLCFYETPFTLTIRLKFAGDTVTANADSNVGFGRTNHAERVGKAK
jgi:CubicO group peptidase (beta-lactamase class C family)